MKTNEGTLLLCSEDLEITVSSGDRITLQIPEGIFLPQQMLKYSLIIAACLRRGAEVVQAVVTFQNQTGIYDAYSHGLKCGLGAVTMLDEKFLVSETLRSEQFLVLAITRIPESAEMTTEDILAREA